MNELSLLAGSRAAMARRRIAEFIHTSRLRAVVVCSLIAGFWVLMFAMFLEVFRFLDRDFSAISGIVLDYLFAFMFLSLLVMMTISDAIIAYTSLFRSEETEFLFSLPMQPQSTFAFRSADSLIFSFWGIGTLVVPMLVAYCVVFPSPWYFFPFAVALSVLLVLLAAETGGLLALLAALLLPRSRRRTLIAAAVLGALVLGLWALPLRRHLESGVFNQADIRSIMDRIAFCQHWALPSRWVSHGMLSASRGDPAQAGFLAALLLSNVLFVGMTASRVAFYAYRRTWQTVHGASSRRRIAGRGVLGRLIEAVTFFLPFQLRQLVLKDMKTFLRDPSQWSQFLLFFGLLGLYIVNLPRFEVTQLEDYWHSLISLLNLGATCLTLATLTTRFVFPQLSLEGRRIWILGLMPVSRPLVLWGKFLFTTIGTFAVSGGLVLLSDTMLRLGPWVVLAHVIVVACVCCGLNGLAVGLGALYPRPETDNPSKIVGSFGGTLNLMCSICFIALAVLPVALPLHLHVMGVWKGGALAAGLAVGFGVAVLASCVATLVPMVAGARAFSRMEF